MSKVDMKSMFKSNSSVDHWQEQSEKREAEMAAIEQANAPAVEDKKPHARKTYKVKKVSVNLCLSQEAKELLNKYAAKNGISSSLAVENFIKKCAKLV